MLTAAPVMWMCDSGFKLRDFIDELSRWVLGPKFNPTVDHRAPRRLEKGEISLITTDAASCSCRQAGIAALVPTPFDLVVNLRRSDEGTVGFVGNLPSSHDGSIKQPQTLWPAASVNDTRLISRTGQAAPLLKGRRLNHGGCVTLNSVLPKRRHQASGHKQHGDSQMPQERETAESVHSAMNL